MLVAFEDGERIARQVDAAWRFVRLDFGLASSFVRPFALPCHDRGLDRVAARSSEVEQGQDDDGRFQPFRAVDGHQAHLVGRLRDALTFDGDLQIVQMFEKLRQRGEASVAREGQGLLAQVLGRIQVAMRRQ